MYEFQYLQKMLCRQVECATVSQEYLSRSSAGLIDALDIRPDLLYRNHSEFQVLEQITELTFIIATAYHNGQLIRRSLHWCSADLSFIFHITPPAVSVLL